jgi:hypothetical protein
MADATIHVRRCDWDEGGSVVITITLQCPDPAEHAVAQELAEEMLVHKIDLVELIEGKARGDFA